MIKLIVCAGMPRSGSTIQYRIVKEILKNKNNLIDLGWIDKQDLNEIIYNKINQDKTILVKIHEYNPIFKKLNSKCDIKVITSFRDIRDVFVSLMAFKKVGFEDVFSKYAFNKIISDFKKWQEFHSVYVGKYEEFYSELKREIDNISIFLNITIDNPLKEKIYLSVVNTKVNSLSSPQYDPNTLLHSNHINDGSARQWKSKLTKIQIGIIQNIAKKWLIQNGYKIEYSIYNYSLIWKTVKLWRHVKQGTLIRRITDNYHKINNELQKLKESQNGFITHRLSSKVKIRLYKDSHLSRIIVWGDFELNEIDFLKRYLNSGDVFIDIGANIGLFSLIASPILSKYGRIISIEPSKKTYFRLLENIKLNKFKNISCINNALSNSNEKKNLYVDTGGYDAWNSFGKPSAGNFLEKEEVITKTLDQIRDQFSLQQVQLIKIDVEGWEIPVLQGGKKLLLSNNAPVLMVEFTDQNAKNAGYSCKQLYELGETYGYKWYNYDSGSNKLKLSLLKDDYPYENLIAIKEINKVTKILGE